MNLESSLSCARTQIYERHADNKAPEAKPFPCTWSFNAFYPVSRTGRQRGRTGSNGRNLPTVEAFSSQLHLEFADPLRVDLNLPSGSSRDRLEIIPNKLPIIPSVQRRSHAEPGGAQAGSPLTPQVIIHKPKWKDTNKVTLKVQVKLQVLPGGLVNSTGGSRGDTRNYLKTIKTEISNCVIYIKYQSKFS